MKILSIFLLIICICSSTALAEIYKWRDESGKLHFSDTPPVTDHKVKEITVKDNIATGVPQTSKADIPVTQTKQIDTSFSKSKAPNPSLISAESYKISSKYETEGDYVIFSGRIGSGPKCNNLRIELFAVNENGRRAHLIDMTSIDSSFGSALFNAKGRVYGLKGDRSDWETTSLYVTCSD